MADDECGVEKELCVGCASGDVLRVVRMHWSTYAVQQVALRRTAARLAA
jgi:hypothetical protein